MSKIKLALVITAISVAIGSAFATRVRQSCEYEPQYYQYRPGFYLPAGSYGVDYYCSGSVGNCTYYLVNPYDPTSFAPCQTGYYTRLH